MVATNGMKMVGMNGFMILEELENPNMTEHGLILPPSNSPHRRYKVVSLPDGLRDDIEIKNGDVVILDRSFVYPLETPLATVLVAQLDNVYLREARDE